MTTCLRWGFAGAGLVANDFANAMRLVPEARIVAVAARSGARAEEFARAHACERWYDSYAELFRDEEVDVVYINVLHPWHKDLVIQAIQAGKHVVCEKPLGMNKKEVQAMVSAARAHDRFLLEGVWSRFFPAVRELRRLVASGAIGDVRSVSVDFSVFMNASADDKQRVFSRDLGGGGEQALPAAVQPRNACPPCHPPQPFSTSACTRSPSSRW